MSRLPMIGARCPVEWQQQIDQIAEATGRKPAEVVREALSQYLQETQQRSKARSPLLNPA